jgi:hypothetical protein
MNRFLQVLQCIDNKVKHLTVITLRLTCGRRFALSKARSLTSRHLQRIHNYAVRLQKPWMYTMSRQMRGISNYTFQFQAFRLQAQVLLLQEQRTGRLIRHCPCSGYLLDLFTGTTAPALGSAGGTGTKAHEYPQGSAQNHDHCPW